MNIYYAVLAGILTAAVVAVAVYLILVLLEIRDTVREVDALARKVNNEVDKVQNITSAVAGVAGAVSGSVGQTAVSIAKVLFQVVQHFRRKKSSAEDKEEVYEREQE